ncbi:MAG: DUF364 domain-containing protein [Bacteroidota bacterium]
MSIDPLQLIYNSNKPNPSLIKKIIFGERQLVVLLKNEHLGSCTTLGNHLFADIEILNQPDFTNISHRAMLISYYNAYYNYSNKSEGHCDITDIIDFSKYSHIVMIGYFRTLAKKIDDNNIPLYVFDLENVGERLTDMQLQLEYLGNADAVIVSATTFLNNTFGKILENTNSNCDVFLLGPSSILCHQLFSFKNLKCIFGAAFIEPEKVLSTIEEGVGIKDIRPYMQKIYIKSTESLQ